MIGIETDSANGKILGYNASGQDGPQGLQLTPQPVVSPGATDASPTSIGDFAQANAFSKGGYFKQDGNLYHQREGKVYHVTGAPEGDRELNSAQAAEVNARRGQGQDGGGGNVPTDGSGSEFKPRPAPTPRKQVPDISRGEADDRPNPMNRPYDPESVAVRGKGGQPLPDELKQRVGERLKGTNFENMDLGSLKLYRGKAPWYMPSDKGGITLENHIYVPDAGFDPENDIDHFNVLVEEAVHAGQFQYRDMTRAGYLWESLLHGYEGNKHEVEAKGIAFGKKRVSEDTLYE